MKRLSFDLVAAGVVFLAVIIVPLVVASDLRIVFDYALNDAVSEWNSVVGQHLVFCEQPCSNNHDNATTVIDTVSDEVTPGKGSTSGGGACGAAIACHVSRTAAHLGDSRVIIEEPAYEYSADKAKHYRAIWTNDPGQHGREVPGQQDTSFVYLPMVIMHELGHGAGLTDLYQFMGDYSNYLMGTLPLEGLAITVIPVSDIDYVREVYREHDH